MSDMNDLDLSVAGTPEELFVINPRAPVEINTDAVVAATIRAKGILNAIMLIANEDEAGHPLRSPWVINSLWAVEGLLEQVEILMKQNNAPEHRTRAPLKE